jgi:hypothetical protein
LKIFFGNFLDIASPAVVRNGVKHQNDFSFYILKTGESETRNGERMEK